MKSLFWFIEDFKWGIRCSYNYWLHGPYGLSKVIENMPFRFIVKYLRKYGATIGENCRFERGLNIHRPLGKKPFENLVIGNGVYLGHNTLLDLTCKIELKDNVIFASRCQVWTHASNYTAKDLKQPGYEEKKGEVCVEECAIIYSNVIIAHGTKIGQFSKIGASSLLNKNTEPNSFYSGVPAARIK